MKIAYCKYIWRTYGYEWGEEEKKVGMMWAGVQIYACFVTALLFYQGILQVDWKIVLPSIYRQKQKRRRESLKHPHARPLGTVSHHKSEFLWLSKAACDEEPIWGCVIFSSHKTCISKTYFLFLKACVGCLFAGKGPWHAAVPQSSSGMRFAPSNTDPWRWRC